MLSDTTGSTCSRVGIVKIICNVDILNIHGRYTSIPFHEKFVIDITLKKGEVIKIGQIKTLTVNLSLVVTSLAACQTCLIYVSLSVSHPSFCNCFNCFSLSTRQFKSFYFLKWYNFRREI